MSLKLLWENMMSLMYYKPEHKLHYPNMKAEDNAKEL